MESKLEPIREAIAIMTAWNENTPEDRSLTEQTVLAMLSGSRDESEVIARLEDIAAGLVSLCGLLLTRRESEMGVSPAETLQMYGQQVAGRE